MRTIDEKKKEIVLDFFDYININGNGIIKTMSCYSVYTESDNYLQFYSDIANNYNIYYLCEIKIGECAGNKNLRYN